MQVPAYVWQDAKAVQSLATGCSAGSFSGTRTPLIRTHPLRVKALAPWQLCNVVEVAKQSTLVKSCASPTLLFIVNKEIAKMETLSLSCPFRG